MLGFGTYRVTDQTVIENAILCGYNHFDTAELYKNEQIVKQAIDKVAKTRIYITTKVSKKSILENKIEESVNGRLKIFDYIDILLLHIPSVDCKRDWETLCELYIKYKDRIGHIGVSNYDIIHLEQLSDCKIKPFCNQIELSVFYTRVSLVEYLRNHDIIIVSHTTLTRAEKFDNSQLRELALKYNVSVAKVLLLWAIQNGYNIIPKTCSKEHMIENMEYNTWLSKQDINLLNSLNENFYITKV